MKRLACALLALAATALPAIAQAQALSCSVPDRIDSYPPITPDGPSRSVPIGGYTLALSWSPEFCQHARARPGDMQCGGRNRFGFILHGLWPEGANGPPPQWCGNPARPSPDLLRRNLCMTPSAHTLEHEWLKHGACATRTPEDYFTAEQRLWSSLHLPDATALSRRQGLTVGDLRQAFVAANPAIPREAVALKVNGAGYLTEMDVCYSARLAPVACDRRGAGAGDARSLKIWRD